MEEQVQWYVTIAGNAVGPVSTDLVLRGIKHKKIATEAYVCVVGASEWQALTDVPEFHGALEENGLLPSTSSAAIQPANSNEPSAPSTRWSAPMASGEVMRNADEGDETESTAQLASSRPVAAQPESPDQEMVHATATHAEAGTAQVATEPLNGKHAPGFAAREPLASIDVDVDVHMDEPDDPRIDWNNGFAEYFLVGAEVTLPEEPLLLRSLASAPRDTFLNDEPLWNLALCLAFGSNAVASVAADVFFNVVAAHARHDRIEWMGRTLLSRGFMPSGIPHVAGNRGIDRLRQACPDELRLQLESQLGI